MVRDATRRYPHLDGRHRRLRAPMVSTGVGLSVGPRESVRTRCDVIGVGVGPPRRAAASLRPALHDTPWCGRSPAPRAPVRLRPRRGRSRVRLHVLLPAAAVPSVCYTRRAPPPAFLLRGPLASPRRTPHGRARPIELLTGGSPRFARPSETPHPARHRVPRHPPHLIQHRGLASVVSECLHVEQETCEVR